ncbi:MAG: isoaspartyl peptidase/L-asparaginase family protein [Nitrospirota bacterium]
MLLIIHGGAGTTSPSKSVMKTITASLSIGYRVLEGGGTGLDAVVDSIKVLEDSGLFNAGAGGNLQADGVRRLDASLMEGISLRAGSVINIEGIRNPITAAKLLMESPHVILTNQGAQCIAKKEKLPRLPKPDNFALAKLERSLKSKGQFFAYYQSYFSTVGAVALDRHGNLAAGSSTGGISAMLPGRVGDTPIIGAGIYADAASGAVSCTGMGEYIIRLTLAKEIVMNLVLLPPRKAALKSLRRIQSLGGEAGVIAVNARGQFSISHTTHYMPSGYATKKGIVVQDGFNRIR